MCTSILQTTLNICLFLTLGLLVTSIVYPSWTQIDSKNKITFDRGLVYMKCGEAVKLKPCVNVKDFWNLTFDRGLVYMKCGEAVKLKPCVNVKDFWNSMKAYEIVTLELMLIALTAAILALIWSCLTVCYKSCVLVPIPILCVFGFGCSLAGLLVYYFKSYTDNFVHDMKHIDQPFTWRFGRAAYLGVLSANALLIDTLMAILLLQSASKVSPV